MKGNTIDTTMLDGRMLYYCFIAGAKKLIGKQDHLNRINVFPVHDSDTGNNMAATMQMVIELTKPKENISEMAHSIADAALWGGHGNSGIIAGQFLYGFSCKLENDTHINVDQFSDAIKTAVKYAYEAISNPVEGTIISVMREWSDEISTLKDKVRDFDRLIFDSYHAANKSLQDTPNKLKVLARSKVVDAGAQGFIYFLDGVIEFLKHKNLRAILSDINTVEIDTSKIIHSMEDIPFRYCCEAIITGAGINKNEIKCAIDPIGRSTIIAGSSAKVKIHQHTNCPSDLFESLSLFGPVIYQKVDDMKMQNSVATNRLHNTAILTDTSFSIPQEEVDKHQIHVIPGRLNIANTNWIDSLTIKPDRLYKIMEDQNIGLPTTASASYKDFIDKYTYLCAHYSAVIAFHGSVKLSATIAVSRKAANEISHKTGTKITVVDLGKSSAELVLRASQALDAGLEYEALLDKINEWSLKIELISTTTSLQHALRSGRLKNRGLFRLFKNIKPTFRQAETGDQKLISVSFTEKWSLKRTQRIIEKVVVGKKIWGYSITHANNNETARWFADQIEMHSGKKARYINQVSPSIGALVGPGAVAILIMFE